MVRVERERSNTMKPISYPKATATVPHSDRRYNLPSRPQRVEIDFLPQSDWTIEVGNPRPDIQSCLNHHKPVARPTKFVSGFAPIELVIAAAFDARRHQHPISLGANFAN